MRQEGLSRFQQAWAGQDVLLLETDEELRATLSHHRFIVFISVEWSGPERIGRRRFAELASRVASLNRDDLPVFAVVCEYSEGIEDWFRRLQLPSAAAQGNGAIA